MRFTLQIGQILQFLRYKTYILYTVYPPYPLNDLRFRGTLLITTLVNWSIVRTLRGPGLLRTRKFSPLLTVFTLQILHPLHRLHALHPERPEI